MRLVFNVNQRKYNHKRCCGVTIRLNAGIPGQIKNSCRASISNSKNVTSRSSWRKDTYIYIIFNLYIYMSFFPNPNQDRTIGRESLASLLQQPSSNQGLHNCWTVISLALLTIDILRSKCLAKKRKDKFDVVCWRWYDVHQLPELQQLLHWACRP